MILTFLYVYMSFKLDSFSENQIAAATTLQTLCRAVGASKNYQENKNSVQARVTAVSEEHIAATTLQTLYRFGGSDKELWAQREIYWRSEPLISVVLDLLKQALSTQQASDGEATVYLYLDLVLKLLTKDSAEKLSVPLETPIPELAAIRCSRSMDAQQVLTRQRARHLVIPGAIAMGDYIVEKRVPVKTGMSRLHQLCHNYQIYVENSGLFNEPVREWTRFACERYISGLLSNPGGGRFDPISNIGVKSSGFQTVRFDNFAYSIVKCNGKREIRVFFVDIERVMTSEQYEQKNLKNYVECAFNTLARIFPYHIDIIIDEMKRHGLIAGYEGSNDPNIQINKTVCLPVKDLSKRERGKKYLEVVYTNHVAWLTENGISLDNPPFEISQEKSEQLLSKLSADIFTELEKLNSGCFDAKWYNNIYIINVADKYGIPHENAAYHAPKFNYMDLTNGETLARNIAEQFLEKIKSAINNARTVKSAATKAELVSLRSLNLKRADLTLLFYKSIEGVVHEHQRLNVIGSSFYTVFLAERLLYVAMQALSDGKVIYYYDSGYYTQDATSTRDKDICWIRY